MSSRSRQFSVLLFALLLSTSPVVSVVSPSAGSDTASYVSSAPQTPGHIFDYTSGNTPQPRSDLSAQPSTKQFSPQSNNISAQTQVSSVNITQIQTQNFPDVDVFAKLEGSSGTSPEDIDVSDLTLSEDGRQESVRDVRVLENNRIGSVSTSLVIDRSGSMGGQKLQDAKKAAKEYVSNFVFDDEAALFSFSSSTSIDQRWTRDEGELNDAIDSLSDGGSTALFDAAFLGVVQAANRDGRSTVIVLTDGNDNSGNLDSPDKVIEAAKGNDTTIYTIGLGGGINEKPLKRMASATGGEYFAAPDSNELTDIYTDIGGRIQEQFLIRYTTSNRTPDGSERTVQLTSSGGTSGSSTYEAPGSVVPDAKFTYEVVSDKTVRFNASASSVLQGSIENYRWDIQNDGKPDGVGRTFEFTYTSKGEKEVKLTVTDDEDASASSIATINLSARSEQNLPPKAQISLSPRTPATDQPVELSATDSFDPNGDDLSYKWDTNGDGQTENTSQSISLNLSEGDYQVSLNVSDNNLSDKTTTSFEVVPASAKPDIEFSAFLDGSELSKPYTATVGEPVTLSASGSDLPPPNTIARRLAVSWQVNSDPVGTGTDTSYQFETAGKQTVRLTLTSNDGVANTTTKTFQVEERNRPYIRNIDVPTNGIIPQLPGDYFGNSVVKGRPKTFTADVTSSGGLDRVEFKFPNGLIKTVSSSNIDGDTASVTLSPDEFDKLTDGTVTVTATNIQGRTHTVETNIDTFDLPSWIGFYRINDGTLKGGLKVGSIGGPTQGIASNVLPDGIPPEVEFGFIAGELTVTAGAQTNVTHRLGTRTANFEIGGKGKLEVVPTIGPGIGTSAELTGDAKTRVTDDDIQVRELGLTLEIDSPLILVVQSPSVPIIGSPLGIESRLIPSDKYAVTLDTYPEIDPVPKSFAYTTGLTLIPLQIKADVVVASATVGGELGASGTLSVSRNGGIEGILRGSSNLFVKARAGWFVKKVVFGPDDEPIARFNALNSTRAGQKSAIAIEKIENKSHDWKPANKRSATSPGSQLQRRGETASVTTDNIDTDITAITADTLGDREPAIKMINDNKTAIWAAQRPDQTIANGTEITTASETTTGWSDPERLTENNRYETFPDIAATNGRTGAVWARANQPLSVNNTDLSDVFSTFEIVVGERSDGALVNQTTVTDNAVPDIKPRIVGVDDQWLVAWVQDTDGNLSTQSDRELRYVVLSEHFSEVRDRASVESVRDFAVATTDDTFRLGFVDDSSSELIESEVVQTEVSSNGEELNRKETTAPNATEIAVTNKSAAWLSNTSGGKQITIDRPGRTQVIEPDANAINKLRFHRTPQDRILTYRGSINGSRGVYYQLQRTYVNEWTEPTELRTSDTSVNRIATTASKKGIGLLIESAPTLDTRADLFSVQQSLSPADLAVEIDSNGVTRSVAPIDIVISNRGDQTAPARNVVVDTAARQLNISVPDLDPGESVTREVTVEQPTVSTVSTKLSPETAPNEVQTSNNDAQFNISTDISVGAIRDRLSRNGSQVVALVNVSNNGPVPTTQVTVTAQAGGQTITKQIGGIGVSQTTTTEIRFNATQIADNSNLSVVASTPGQTDGRPRDNARQTTIRRPDVGVTPNVVTGPTYDTFGQQARIYVQSGDTGNPDANVTVETSSGSISYQLPIPPAPDETSELVQPAVLTVPEADDGDSISLSTQPTSGLDTNPVNNVAQATASATSQNFTTLQIESVETATGSDAAIQVELRNPSSAIVGEIVRLENQSQTQERHVAVAPLTTQTVTVDTNITGETTITTLNDTENLNVSAGNAPVIVGPTPATDVDNDQQLEDVNGDTSANVLDVVALFDNLENPDVTSNAKQFNFNGDNSKDINILDIVALSNELDR